MHASVFSFSFCFTELFRAGTPVRVKSVYIHTRALEDPWPVFVSAKSKDHEARNEKVEDGRRPEESESLPLDSPGGE